MVKLMSKKPGRVYLCIDHVGPFQLAMKKLGRGLVKPQLVVGEERTCDVCGARSGPHPEDPYIFEVEIRPSFDQELIAYEWSFMDKLLQQGLCLQEAIQVVAGLEEHYYGVIE